jgi:hypothetical protein
MAYSGIYALDLGIDTTDQIWVVGQDLRMFDGSQWAYYNFTNSAVPSAYPFYLDTRTISISPEDKKWIGCGMSSSLSDTAVFYIDSEDVTKGKSWSFNDIDTFDLPMEVSKIYACPFGNDVLAFLNPLNTSDVTFSGSYSPVTYWREIGTGLTGADARFLSFYNSTTGYFGGPLSTNTGGIYYTSDGGNTWELAGGSSSFPTYQGLLGDVGFSSNGVAVLNFTTTLYRYLSAPNVWTTGGALPSSPKDAVDVAFCYSDSFVIVLYEDGSVDKSSNGGVTFTAQSGISTGSNFTRLGGAFNGLKVYAAGASGPFPGAIFLSTNTGTSFASTPVYTGNAPIYDVHVNPANLNRVYAVGATGTIIRSNSQGAAGTWVSATTVPTTEDLKSIRFSPTDQNVGWAVGASGTILKTVDSGVNWAFDLTLNPFEYDINYLDIQSSTLGFGAGNNNKIVTFRSYEGPTGGNQFLYRYDIPNDEWKRVADGYTWPFIYDIIARGFGGNSYRYYLGTDRGIIEIPGEELGTDTLEGGMIYLPSANFYNSNNSLGLSDNVYVLDLDENFNLWAGTEEGKLQFWDFESPWKVFDPYYGGLPGYPVTAIKARENGHIFSGSNYVGSLIRHFNGATSGVLAIPGPVGDTLKIETQRRNRNTDGVLTYENDLWVLLSDNNLYRLSYELPHVKASSNYSGATGWNFTYFTQATGSVREFSSSIPNVNKYTWEYPYWRSYQDSHVQYDLPGLDPRNLFLTTNLSDIASGKAGKQEYWNSSPLPEGADLEIEESVREAKWAQILSNLEATNLETFQITCSALLNHGGYKKFLVGGNTSGLYNPFDPISDFGVNVGRDLNGNPVYVYSTNPSLFGSYSVQGGSTYDYSSPGTVDASMGFVITYNSDGLVENVLTIPGKSTGVRSIEVSDDQDSVYVLGTFNGFIESGDYIWSSLTGTPGPTGAPIGLTNSDVPGLASDFSWIYENGATAALSLNSGLSWTYRGASDGNTSDSNFRFYRSNGYSECLPVTSIVLNANASSAYDLTYIGLGLSNVSGLLDYTSDFYSGMVIRINVPGFIDYVYYRIDSILFFKTAPEFSSGSAHFVKVSYLSGSAVIAPDDVVDFNFYFWDERFFPLLKENATLNSSIEDGTGVYVMELTPNIGGTVTLTDSDQLSGWDYQVRRFRHFPALYEVASSSTVWQLDADTSAEHLAMIFEYDYILGSSNHLSTLANSWRRTTDNQGVPLTLSNPGTALVDYGTIILERSDLSIRSTGVFGVDTGTYENNINALHIATIEGTNTAMISGSSRTEFSFSGITFTNSSLPDAKPFYLIYSYGATTGAGVTGGFILDLGGQTSATNPGRLSSGYLSKKDGFYVLGQQYYGGPATGSPTGSGVYLGKSIELTNPGMHLATGFINPYNYVDKVVYGTIPGGINVISSQGYGSSLVPTADSYSAKPKVTNRGELVGFFAGTTGSSFANSLQTQYIFKQNLSSGKIELLSFDNVKSTSAQTMGVNINGDIVFTGINSSSQGGSTGPAWLDYVTTDTTQNVYVFYSEQYEAPTGINMGQIISRPGSNPWTWCDVHQTDRGMEVPLMCTVFFSNYNSALYGKQNNKWILSNAKTGDEILNVKNTPYFIYTFTDAGYYTIYNQVEDAYGNVYEISKSGFITVVDHKVKKANDENPFVVNSSDYGYPIPPKTKREKLNSLEKAMLQDQAERLKENSVPFTSPLIINDNPDATFNQ